MRKTYEPKFNVILRLRGNGVRWLLNAEDTARGEHYASDAHRLAKALVKRKLAESYDLVEVEEPAGLPVYQRLPGKREIKAKD